MAAHPDPLALTRELLHFDTINPPGQEEPCAHHLGAMLEAAGYRCQVGPVLTIEPLGAATPSGPFDLVIFVSEHAVRLGLPRLALSAARVLAVGARTAAALFMGASYVGELARRGVETGVLTPQENAAVQGVVEIAMRVWKHHATYAKMDS
jgi:hypothetical protein